MVFRFPFPSDASRHSKLFFDLHLSNNNKKKRADRPAPPALHGTALPALYRPHRLHGALLFRHQLLQPALPRGGALPRHGQGLLRGPFFFFFLSFLEGVLGSASRRSSLFSYWIAVVIFAVLR